MRDRPVATEAMTLARDEKSGTAVMLLGGRVVGAVVIVGVPEAVPVAATVVEVTVVGVVGVGVVSWAVETIARVARRRKVVTEDLNIILFVCMVCRRG